ncbi:MAG TPA: C4-dicarboxylate transporter DcuC [Tepidisphaeraceae bacterium]|jgi:DcuC family C4-dicarboxylate transporter|nr:C4-dicarboxylate transporter DcuC [Tepidisphaeraceae bacterium]
MPVIPAALVVVFVGGFFLFRRTDVRLVLLLCAAVMFAVHATQSAASGARFNAFAQFFVEFANGLVYTPAVVPICSAMGFAYVCKLTGCDAHLVHLLCAPLRHVRWLLIPGGIAVSYFVNSAIVSQTSTVSVVGPVLIPLLVGAGITGQTAGALLLLGGSMGGELLNPAAVEVSAIKNVTNQDTLAIIRQILPYNLLACATAMLVFWMMAISYERKAHAMLQSNTDEDAEDIAAPGSIAASLANSGEAASIARVNLFKAIVPLIPIILLIFVKPHITMPEFLRPSDKNKIAEQATIAAAMLIGVVCAALTAPHRINQTAAAFFEGAGFAYAHVISVIAAAMTFAASIQVNGLIDIMAKSVQHAPTMVIFASVVVPWLMAAITGTAVGSAPAVIAILLPVAMGTVDPRRATDHGVRIGGVSAITAQFGRTMSPVAPVVIVCATLAHSRPATLVKRILIPLIAGGAVLFLAALFHFF